MAKSSWYSNVLDLRVTNCCSKVLQMKNEKELCTLPSLINSTSSLQAGLMATKARNPKQLKKENKTYIAFLWQFDTVGYN